MSSSAVGISFNIYRTTTLICKAGARPTKALLLRVRVCRFAIALATAGETFELHDHGPL